MKEIVSNCDIFMFPRPGKKDAVCVTTNGILRKDGKAVMGAGIAKYARDHFKGIDITLGSKICKHGNHVYDLGMFTRPDGKAHVTILSFPTKDDWKNDSKPELIRQSCKEAANLADGYLDCIYLPCPGCANGHLDYWKDVRPILLEELNEQFVIIIPEHIYIRKEN